MNDKPGKNKAASVRDRLLSLARERGEDFQLVLTQYGLERLLYRLSQSDYRDRFILKGAMLFLLWNDQPHRPTRDVDFLGYGDNSEAGLQTVFRALCELSVDDDGLTLESNTVRVEAIRDDTEYGGMRVKLVGDLARARVPIQADIGFGDAVTPEASVIDYPTLLDGPAPRLRAYPRETVVAEKYQALVNLGIANTRMKDFYDLWIIAHEFGFDGKTLSTAIRNTFQRRQTALPENTPSGLSAAFYEDVQKNAQWNAFLQKGRLTTQAVTLKDVCLFLESFLGPPTQAVLRDNGFSKTWEPGGLWR